jgi:hypothetical protein
VSDTWLVLFPADPGWVPDRVREARAAEVIGRLIPTAVSGQPELIRTVNIEFVDAGENFECIGCPLCGGELEVGWWRDRMNDQYLVDKGFELQPITAPCCGGMTALNELEYQWPLGFGRWTARVLHPDRGWLSEEELSEIGDVLGNPVRQTIRRI